MLLSFLTKSYRILQEISCWLIIIVSAILMSVLFEETFYFDGRVIVGALLGIVCALDFEITFVVPFMILFEVNNNIDILGRNVRNIDDKIKVIESVVNTNGSSISNHEETNSIPDTYYKKSKSDVWVCSKCGATNPSTSRLCENCGH